MKKIITLTILTALLICGISSCTQPTLEGHWSPSNNEQQEKALAFTGFEELIFHSHDSKSWISSWKAFSGDFNGDGLTDILLNLIGVGNQSFIALSNGDGTFDSLIHYWHSTGRWATSWKTVTGDFNGDGKCDILYSYMDENGNQSYVAMSNGDGTFGNLIHTRHSIGRWSTDWKTLSGDFNGDGLADILFNYNDEWGNQSYVTFSNGDGTFGSLIHDKHSGGNWNQNWKVLADDFNGDGFTDILYNKTDGTSNQSQIVFSNGDGTFGNLLAHLHAQGDWAQNWKIVTGDFDKDGLADLLFNKTDQSGNFSHVTLSNGDGSFGNMLTDWHSFTSWATNWQAVSGDYNGDGMSDILFSITDEIGYRTHTALTSAQ